MNKKNILVTGCAGLLGSHFCRHLLNNGYRVTGIDDLSGGYECFLPEDDNFLFHKFDLKDTKKLKEAFSFGDFSAVYHFAAYAAEGLSPFIRRFNYTNNIISSVNIINECIEREIKIIFTSSMAVYGCSVPPFHEALTPNPCDPYGIAKYAVEQDLLNGSMQFGLEYSIVRPHNVLGIYQNIWDNYRNVIGIFIRKCLDNKPLIIFGDGEQTRAFSDIKYYMTPFESLMDGYNKEIFNIGSDKVYSLNTAADLVVKVAKSYGYSPTVKHAEGRHEVKHAFSNHDKAKKDLNFEDKTDLEELIVNMFKWAEEEPRRPIKKIDYEINKSLYSYWK